MRFSGVRREDAVAQEMLYGKEYTVSVIADAFKRLHSVIPIKVGIKRGITIRAEVDFNEKVINACAKIHESLPTSSTYNIQLMLLDDGSVMPFEINPRISTTICLAVASGTDPFGVFLGEKNSDLQPKGTKLQRFWINEFNN